MKSTLVVLLVMLVAGSAIAAPNTTKPNGPLNIYIDPAGVAMMMNFGPNSTGAAFQFDGYTILSASGVLPADVQGINDNAWALGAPFATMLGMTMQTATAFQEMSWTTFNFSEITMKEEAATLQVGDGINLGSGFDLLDNVDGTFTYVDSASGGSWEGLIIPEPATMSLLALGGLALIRRRR